MRSSLCASSCVLVWLCEKTLTKIAIKWQDLEKSRWGYSLSMDTGTSPVMRSSPVTSQTVNTYQPMKTARFTSTNVESAMLSGQYLNILPILGMYWCDNHLTKMYDEMYVVIWYRVSCHYWWMCVFVCVRKSSTFNLW